MSGYGRAHTCPIIDIPRSFTNQGKFRVREVIARWNGECACWLAALPWPRTDLEPRDSYILSQRTDFQKIDFKMAEYDLTKTIIPYLDRHLVFPLLTHLHESGLFAQDQVVAAQYELAKGTNMVDYIVSLYELLNPDSEAPEGEICPTLLVHDLTPN